MRRVFLGLVIGGLSMAACGQQTHLDVTTTAVPVVEETSTAVDSSQKTELVEPLSDVTEGVAGRVQAWASASDGRIGGTIRIAYTHTDVDTGEEVLSEELVDFLLGDEGAFTVRSTGAHGGVAFHTFNAETHVSYGIIESADGLSTFEYVSTDRPTWGPDANRAALQHLAIDYARAAAAALRHPGTAASERRSPLELSGTGAHDAVAVVRISGAVDPVRGVPVDLRVEGPSGVRVFTLTSTLPSEELIEQARGIDTSEIGSRLSADESIISGRVDSGGYMRLSAEEGRKLLGAGTLALVEGFDVVEYMQRRVVSPFVATCPDEWDCDLDSRSLTLSDGDQRVTIFAARLADHGRQRLGVDNADPYFPDLHAGPAEVVAVDGAPIHVLALADDWIIVVEGDFSESRLLELATSAVETANKSW